MISPFRLPRTTPFGLLERFAEHLTGLSRLDNYYRRRPVEVSQNSDTFLDYGLKVLGINYHVIKGQLDEIPSTGPVIVVANHPLGAVEGVILLHMLRQIRKDVKTLANHYLKNVNELSDLFIGVDVFEGKNAIKANVKALHQAQQHLQCEGLLLVFPAGEVSNLNLRTGELQDKEWSRSIARLLRRSAATTVPIYVDAKNSTAFYLAGKIHPMLRTFLLGREMLNKQSQPIGISIGQKIDFSEVKGFSDDTQLANYLRMNTYLLGTKSVLQLKKSAKELAIIEPIDPLSMQQEVNDLQHDDLLASQDNFSVYCTRPGNIPHILQEIGRIREVNFRATGEGTGLSCDLDQYDAHYLHLFVWDKDRKAVVGAYRLGLVHELMAKQGLNGLYSRSLFRYDERLLKQLGNPIEMGRSVIDAHYQRSLSGLLLLWKGIATYASRHREITHLFGPVSISNDYSALARHLIAATLSVHHYNLDQALLIKPKKKLRPGKDVFWHKDMLSALADIKLLSKLLQRMDQREGVPVLLRQYLTLNGKFISFNVDPKFNDALDGLIVVDLRAIAPRTLGRYMGKVEAETYLAYHQTS
jgi:putative hemolysin